MQQKLKRLKNWNTHNSDTTSSCSSSTSSIVSLSSSSKSLEKKVLCLNWHKMPQINSDSNKYNNNKSNNKSKRNQHSRTTTKSSSLLCWSNALTNLQELVTTMATIQQKHLLFVLLVSLLMPSYYSFSAVNADVRLYESTTPLSYNYYHNDSFNEQLIATTPSPTTDSTTFLSAQGSTTTADWLTAAPTNSSNNYYHDHGNGKDKSAAYENDSIFMRFAKRFSTGNELWDNIIKDCYRHPTFSCFQKNVYVFLNDALDSNDVNVTQRLKFFRNQVDYEEAATTKAPTTESAALADDANEYVDEHVNVELHDENVLGMDEHLLNNEIPQTGRAASAETPIEEVTNALYGKSVKFAMTHDIELKLPEMMFDGATFRISPRSFEGNGIIAKLELIPKQEVEARLAGKFLMKKIQKFFRNKLMLSFIALVLIIKIIKIKLFWLLPLIIGVGAAKKLLLKFLLFLFPALSHLFKLCSYYQQTYHHTTKFHQHHHLINHQHTVLPSWHSAEQHNVPELIYTRPPTGHVSAYLHGAPIHETYGTSDHYDGFDNSGPGLGSEYISDINRAAKIEENSNYFKPHSSNDANEIHVWGLGTTQPTINNQQQQQPQRNPTSTQQQQRPPPIQKQQQYHNHHQQYHKPHTTSHNLNPFLNTDKQSIFTTKLKIPTGAHSAPHPVYKAPPPQRNGGPGGGRIPPQYSQAAQQHPSRFGDIGLNGAQFAALERNNPAPQRQQQQSQQPQEELSPKLSAQIQEALRIQAEQRIIEQQQKILEKQPFVQDGQPIMPLNYDPYYSPILLKIDKIVEQLGVTDEQCKERLVCSMYKDPARYSPHSNFVSAELSRDTSELQPIANANEAVLRFYRLIQAARDGQDQRDCLSLYPQCSINTERK